MEETLEEQCGRWVGVPRVTSRTEDIERVEKTLDKKDALHYPSFSSEVKVNFKDFDFCGRPDPNHFHLYRKYTVNGVVFVRKPRAEELEALHKALLESNPNWRPPGEQEPPKPARSRKNTVRA